VHNLLFCAHTLCMSYVTKTFLLVSSAVRSKQLLCFLHGQSQKSEQKHTKKKKKCRMAVYCTIVKLVTYVDPFYLYFIQFVLFVISATPFSFEYLLRSAHTKGLVSSTEGRTDVRSESHLMGAPLARRRRAGAPLSLSIFPVFLNKLHKFMNVTIP